MQTEAEHRFTNGMAIDEQLDTDRVYSVLQHEFVHNELYTLTTYGQMVLMLEKNAWIDQKSQFCMEILFEYINRMQERTAVNIEIIKECIDNGMSAYNKAVENLKSRNRSYYNYFRKLCCINGKIKSREDAEALSNLLLGIAKIAMNVKLELIPIEEFEDAKRLKRYFDNSKNNAIISPNKRFDILVNTLFRENDNNNDIESVLAGSIDIEKMIDYDYIHFEAYKKVASLYKGSLIENRLVERIKSIGVMRFEFKDANYLSIKPAKINIKNEIYIKIVESAEELENVAKLNNSSELFISHLLGGFEEIHVISVYGMQNNEKVIYSMYIFNENDFFKVLSSIDLNFVFYKTKLINKEGKSIRRMVKKLPIYIYQDSPMLTDLPFIEMYFMDGKWGFLERDGRTIFVVCKRSIIYFTNVVSEARNVLINYFSNKKIYFTEDITEICNINDVYRISKTCNEYETNKITDAKLLK